MSYVSFVETHDNNIQRNILKSLDLIQYSFKNNVKNVVIKPNMCYYWDYTSGATTDPKFIGELISLLREQMSSDINISIVESDASAMKCKYAFKMLGYEKLSKKYEVDLINLSKDEIIEKEVNINNNEYAFDVPLTIIESDLNINVPKIKYLLPLVKISCSLKNVFGCNPHPKKYKYHDRLDEIIVALNKLNRFDLIILDGGYVSGIKPLKLNLIMASQDPVAFDTAASKIASVNPKSVNYLLLAQNEGLGNMNFVSKGMNLNYFKDRFPKRKLKNKVMDLGVRAVKAFGLQKRMGLE